MDSLVSPYTMQQKQLASENSLLKADCGTSS